MASSDIVRDFAAKHFGVAPSGLFVDDEVNSFFPWSKRHQFWLATLATNMGRRSLLIVLDPTQVAHAFRPMTDLTLASQVQENLSLLNSVIREEGVELPRGLNLAWTLRNALCSFGGVVGTRKFFEEQQSALAMWTTFRPQDGAQLLEQCCTDPVLRTHEDTWQLSFRYLTVGGGAEEWSASGTKHQIDAYSARELLPTRTFMWPYF